MQMLSGEPTYSPKQRNLDETATAIERNGLRLTGARLKGEPLNAEIAHYLFLYPGKIENEGVLLRGLLKVSETS